MSNKNNRSNRFTCDEKSALKNANKEQLTNFRDDLTHFLQTLLSTAREDKKVEEVRKLNKVINRIEHENM